MLFFACPMENPPCDVSYPHKEDIKKRLKVEDFSLSSFSLTQISHLMGAIMHLCYDCVQA
jgi:hypothetical protein